MGGDVAGEGWDSNNTVLVWAIANNSQIFINKGFFLFLAKGPLWVSRRVMGGWGLCFTLFSFRDPGWWGFHHLDIVGHWSGAEGDK